MEIMTIVNTPHVIELELYMHKYRTENDRLKDDGLVESHLKIESTLTYVIKDK